MEIHTQTGETVEPIVPLGELLSPEEREILRNAGRPKRARELGAPPARGWESAALLLMAIFLGYRLFRRVRRATAG